MNRIEIHPMPYHQRRRRTEVVGGVGKPCPSNSCTVRRQLKRLGGLDKDIADIEKRLLLWKKDQEAVAG